MTKTITVIGNVGSGKSTLSRVLSEQYPGVLVDVDLFTLNPFLPLYVQDHARWSLATELYFLHSRCSHLSKELKKHKEKIKIIDAGLLMGIEVYAKHHRRAGTMSKEEWSLFRTIAKDSLKSTLVHPDIVIYCKCDIETCLKRIKERGREFENFHSPKYLKDLEKNLSVLIKKLNRDGVATIVLDMTTFDPRLSTHIETLIKEISQYD